MKTILALFACTLLVFPVVAQPADDPEAAVRAVIDRLFDAMRAGDSTAVRSTFAPSMRLMTVTTQGGEAVVTETPADRFVAAVGAPHEEVWDERIWDVEVRVDELLASAWVPYAFYLGDAFSHCGTNAFQLAKLGGTWKILHVTDTRRTEGCEVPERVRRDHRGR